MSLTPRYSTNIHTCKHALSIDISYTDISITSSFPLYFPPPSRDLLQASLTYAEAQMRIDDTTKNDDITKSLRGLNKLAKILKRQRIEKGWGQQSMLHYKSYLHMF